MCNNGGACAYEAVAFFAGAAPADVKGWPPRAGGRGTHRVPAW
jgi:hypothetical protein